MLRLDLKALRKYDESALEAVFHIVEANWASRLTRQVVRDLYDQGIELRVSGSGLRSGSDMSYAFHTTRITRTLPVRWTVRCVAGGGAAHSDIIANSKHDLLVAGSLQHGEFAGISTTWMLDVQKGSGYYYLGLYLNDLLLSHYQLDSPAVSA